MREPSPRWGLAFALLILGSWLVSLLLLLQLPLAVPGLAPIPLVLALVVRCFLQTGLFIVGHDAMHGSLLPQAPRWNDRIGRLALALYAGLPWQHCRLNHRLHHQHAAGPGDPDHHGGEPEGRPDGGFGGWIRWYLNFIAAYLRPGQLLALLAAWGLALSWASPHTPHPAANLLLFWTLPLLLSSLQLFIVGTYLPHRGSPARSGDRHRAASLPLPPALSLLACFHFGYHWEHHQHPNLPWYRLPERRRWVTVPDGTGPALALAARRR
ncbi:MAG: fatty acid desaturase [Cyanobium sp.]